MAKNKTTKNKKQSHVGHQQRKRKENTATSTQKVNYNVQVVGARTNANKRSAFTTTVEEVKDDEDLRRAKASASAEVGRNERLNDDESSKKTHLF